MEKNEQQTPLKPKPIKRGSLKLAIGLILVLVEIKNWLMPNQDIPDALKASNETQQGAVIATSWVIFLVGIGLIVAGTLALRRNRS